MARDDRFMEALVPRVARDGASSLSDAELVAALMVTPSVPTAHELIAKRGGLLALSRASARELAEVPELGAEGAMRLVAALELGPRLMRAPADTGISIRSSADVAAAMRGRTPRDQEVFIAIVLDAKNRIVAERRVASGSIDRCPVLPRDAFREVIREGGSGVVFVHNHPSGDPSPSESDHALTLTLVSLGDALGVRVLDHVIVGGRGEVFSFCDAGVIPCPSIGARETRTKKRQ